MKRKKFFKLNNTLFTQQIIGGLVCLLVLVFSLVGSTLAYFFADDFASNMITMSGKVDILVVSRPSAYKSIEDDTDTNLIIYFEDNYSVLIPGAYIEPTANLKVFQSTTHPLLRAKMNVYLIDMETKEEITDENIDNHNLTGSLYDSMASIATSNGWVYYPEDKYYYYRDTNEIQSKVEETLLKEVEVPKGDEFDVIEFIDEEFQFPTVIDSSYSGYGVKFVITFEAIQNFIPNKQGEKLSNTIENSKLIFDNPNSYPYVEE